MTGVLVDARWIAPHGIGRFAQEVIQRLPEAERISDGPPLLSPVEPLWLSIEVSRRRPGVYFTPGFNPPLWSNVPVVFTIHDLIHLRFGEESSFLKHLYYRFVVQPAASSSARLLTVSEYSKQEILNWIRLPSDRVDVVYNGVSEAFTEEGSIYAPGYPYLLCVSNTKPHKNLKRTLKGFSWSGISSEVKLLLRISPSPQIIEYLYKLGIQDRVVFVEQVTDEELAALYRGAVALLFPSLYEGFGLPALEAMACGTPVLASNVTALPEVVGEAGLLVDPFDVEAIAHGICRLVGDSALREELKRKGLERAKQFTWERTAELTWTVLKEAMES
ncbi:glycosyltransferase family 4 protein [Allomeiothermus silvanus]|uniref:glycosyltransferase family 4 protein n=1 Tax=Allomeiothermus silvanus TaxID=52022 RepID=UPI0023F42B69|nr:glycosyltransferase family 1 protein [Allomeiothermus silvanus]